MMYKSTNISFFKKKKICQKRGRYLPNMTSRSDRSKFWGNSRYKKKKKTIQTPAMFRKIPSALLFIKTSYIVSTFFYTSHAFEQTVRLSRFENVFRTKRVRRYLPKTNIFFAIIVLTYALSDRLRTVRKLPYKNSFSKISGK